MSVIPFFPYKKYSGASSKATAAPFAVDVDQLSVGYPSGDQMYALDNVSLQVPSGARIALVGPNGAGKSTLLKAIAGLLKVQSGSIHLYGNPVGAEPQRVAYLPQRGEIDWRFPISLHKLVVTGRYVHLGWFRRPSADDHKKADEMIRRLGLSALADRQIGQLSGGQQQRALLARALTQNADLLLLDEPLNAVDSQTRAVIADVLNQLQREGKTVLAATHDLGRLETDYDDAMYLAEGREVAPPPGAFTGQVRTKLAQPKPTFTHKAG
ncbi:MAG: ABC transporter ATP-binding protein [Chloroflexi bacterium]|nr:ABC transporter ATP-binding protein [Chloroflexota bacterium]